MKKIGIDIGGTGVKGGLFCDGQLIKEASAPTHGREGREAIFTAIYTVIDALFENGTPIGVSSAGNINPETGRCVYATENLSGWTGVEIAKTIAEKYNTTCKADNDAVCALMGELTFCAELKDVTMLTFGTGVGGASLVNGAILRGKSFDAARWGHIPLVSGGRLCSCGKRGCAEAYLSATALKQAARTVGLDGCKELFRAAERGDAAAKKGLRFFGRRLNVLLDIIRTAVAPQLILLGGGVMQSRETICALLERKDDVAFARLGTRAGIYGAAALI